MRAFVASPATRAVAGEREPHQLAGGSLAGNESSPHSSTMSSGGTVAGRTTGTGAGTTGPARITLPIQSGVLLGGSVLAVAGRPPRRRRGRPPRRRTRGTASEAAADAVTASPASTGRASAITTR